MNAKKMLVYFLGAAAAWWVYQKFTFTQKVKFDVADVSIDGSFYNPLVIVTVLVTNPTNVSTDISNINASLFLNDGEKVADVYAPGITTIQPVSQTSIGLNVYPSLTSVVKSLQEVLATRSGSFTLKGSAQADGVTIPFNIKYKFL